MIRSKINSDFSGLKEFTLSLPRTFDNIGQIILNNRNVVKKVSLPEGTFVVKDFKGMYFLNRLSYSTVAVSKAQRSFRNSKILNEKGIATPAHVGWVDCYSLGLLTKSYFVSVFQPYKTFRETLQRNSHDESKKQSLYAHLLRFMARLHKLGIFHDDFSLTNILVIPTTAGYDFSLVDLNRISFRKISFRKGLQNFNKLDLPAQELNHLVRGYAIQAGEPVDEAVDLYWADHKRAQFLRNTRRALRRYTLTPLEKLFREGLPGFMPKHCNAEN